MNIFQLIQFVSGFADKYKSNKIICYIITVEKLIKKLDFLLF
jgi:hypothetical protein